MSRFEFSVSALVAVLIILTIIPFSFWYEVNDLFIHDSVQGEPIILEYDGTVKREFPGAYAVVMRHAGSGSVYCEAQGGPFTYKVGAERPDPITMSWWAFNNDQCHGVNVEAGTYRVETCWTNYALPLFEKRKCVTSNVFRIYAKGEMSPQQRAIDGG